MTFLVHHFSVHECHGLECWTANLSLLSLLQDFLCVQQRSVHVFCSTRTWGRADPELEWVWAFHLVLGEQNSGRVYVKSSPREDWQSGVLAFKTLKRQLFNICESQWIRDMIITDTET